MFYEHGPGIDEPVMSFDYTTFEFGTFHGDEHGSVIAAVAPGGTSVNRYDDYGNPQSGAITGRFGYTGQVWLQQAGLYHYRARAYNPAMGRFMQTDPIGYDGGMNLYAYVGNNPVNFTDPLGLQQTDSDVEVNGRRLCPRGTTQTVNGGCTQNNLDLLNNIMDAVSGLSGFFSGLDFGEGQTVVVTGPRQKRSGPSKNDRHTYSLLFPTVCSPSASWGHLREAGSSAPGSPAAREGFTPRIVLYLNNPISQRVDSSTMTITNTTLPGHAYYPGTVTLRVIAAANNTSDISIRGTGTGPDWFLNDTIGMGYFGLVGNSIMSICLSEAGLYSSPLVP